MEAISAAARSSLQREVLGQSTASVPMLLWSAWRSSLQKFFWDLFGTWSSGPMALQAESFGLELLDIYWCKDVARELEILRRICDIFPMRSVQRAVLLSGIPPGISMRIVQHPGLKKVALLVDTVIAVVPPGFPALLLAEFEYFAGHRGQWLKVAGLEKAEIIEAALQDRPSSAHVVAGEFGAFVGYTAVRLSMLLGRETPAHVSLEVNPIHVCVAHHMLDFAHLADAGEVRPGLVKDALSVVLEEVGQRSLSFLFMDHRGTIFHHDAALLEKYLLQAAHSTLLADNTLNPGSPVLLWERCNHLARGAAAVGRATFVPYALTEFLADHEDWTSIAVC